MSTPVNSNSVPPQAAVPPVASGPREIKLISHSSLFYWWPVWAFGFFMALFTAIENHRFAVVPADTQITKNENGEGYTLTTKSSLPKSLEDAVQASKLGSTEAVFPTRVTQRAWLGSVFVVILLIVIVITNVPLRGLWSFMVILGVIVLSLVITVFNGWDLLYDRIAALKIYMNMAAYLTISTAIFLIWAIAVFGFDRRTFILFTPGQIKVCEHIGSSVRTYDATGVTFEKQRDDLFRHYILGFGSGDLIVRTAGAERHEIRMQNVLGIGWKLIPIEDLLREKTTVSAQ
jgi:hypothetical protein